MNIVKAFDYKQSSIRTVTIDDITWFITGDVCGILGLENVGQALARLDDDEKMQLTGDTLIILNDDPSVTRLSAISEAGLYSLVLNSRKPEAKPFKRWVTHEVLPSIRKTGKYDINQSLPDVLEISRGVKEIRDNMGNFSPDYTKRLIEQYIDQKLGNEIKSFVGDADPVYRGASAIAKDMNFTVTKSNRGPFGRFMKKELPHIVKYQQRQCNGSPIDVAVYPDTQEVRDKVALFFNR